MAPRGTDANSNRDHHVNRHVDPHRHTAPYYSDAITRVIHLDFNADAAYLDTDAANTHRHSSAPEHLDANLRSAQ